MKVLTHSQPGLQQVEKLVITLSNASRIRSTFDVSKIAVAVCNSLQGLTISVYFLLDHYVGM